MLPKLREYQTTLLSDVRAAWELGARNVLMRLDTGGGKTVCLSTLIAEHQGAAAVIAHRDNLVYQLSMALAEAGVIHRIVAADKTIRMIVNRQMKKLGRSFHSPTAQKAVASVQTLINGKGLEAWWWNQVTLWVVDEGHHVVEDNIWHRCLLKFTNPLCRGLLPTATPSRADGRGLGRGHGGVADWMVEGPPMRWLIENGFLTDYRVICARSNVVDMLEQENAAKSGDYSTAAHDRAADKSAIAADVARVYGELLKGQRAVVFAPTVKQATKMRDALLAAGVRAALVIGDMDPDLRDQYLQQLERAELDVVLAVDVISEGFDLPAIVAAILARMTQSLATYMQQLGRALRPLWAEGSGYGPGYTYDLNTKAGRLASIAASPKPRAIIVDLVGNFVRHFAPDRPRPWHEGLLGRRVTPSDAIPSTECQNVKGFMDGAGVWKEPCGQPYERFHTECPHCGFKNPPKDGGGRSDPESVDGDLFELSDEVLALMRGEVSKADMPPDEYARYLADTGLRQVYLAKNVRAHAEAQEARSRLRELMAQFGGIHHAGGRTDREIQKLFFLTFGVDVLTAMAMSRADAEKLAARVDAHVNARAYA